MKRHLFFRTIDLGVKFELILKIFIVALFSSLLMGSLVYKFFEASLIKREKSQIRIIVSRLSHRNNLEDLNLDTLSIYGLNSLFLLDNNFKPVYGIGTPPAIPKKSPPHFSIVKRGLIYPDYLELKAIFPVKENKKKGFLYLSKELKELNQELYEIRKALLFIVLSTTILIIALLHFLLHATITKPIDNIVNDINMIENGEKSLLEGNYLREFNYLILNFNNLLKLTDMQRKELESKLNEVQYLNDLLSKFHEEMSRFEKLISIGELSAGIAHEIGNPLNNIMGYISLIKDKANSYRDDELMDFIDRIDAEILRIHGIVKEMLEFSRKEGNIKLQPVDLTELIDKTIVLAELMKKDKEISILKDYPRYPPLFVEIDPNRFQQVLLNVFSNAIDGIENKGTIKIKIKETSKLNALEAQYLNNIPGNYVRLEIEDNGIGIDKKDLKHIFDPFFTTKEPGRGTGLGLSISLRLIEEMNGIFNIESEKGKGTKAIIILPIRK